MFTGIIEQTGKVKSINKKGKQGVLTVQFHEEVPGLSLGESIAVNGVCLTVANAGDDYFAAHVSEETLSRTNLGELQLSAEVNLERALKLGERLGGHLVSGHVDGTGRITKKIKKGEDVLLTIEADKKIMRYVIEKGSIAVDGISLSVACCGDKSFTIAIIPHTERRTNLKQKKAGDRVNLENDMIGKYIEKFVVSGSKGNEKKSTLSKEFLQLHGFAL